MNLYNKHPFSQTAFQRSINNKINIEYPYLSFNNIDRLVFINNECFFNIDNTTSDVVRTFVYIDSPN